MLILELQVKLQDKSHTGALASAERDNLDILENLVRK